MKLLINKLFSFEVGISLILVFSLWGISFPRGSGVVYLLIGIYLVLLIARKRVVIPLNTFICLFILCVFVYMWGLLMSGESPFQYRVVIGDMYGIVWSSLFILIIWGGLSSSNIDKFKLINKRMIVTVMFVISLIGLWKYYNLLQGIYFPYFNFNGIYAYGAVLSSDMSMFSLAILIGLIMTMSLFYHSKSVPGKLLYSIPLITMTLTMFFSGSRRGFILTIILYGFAGLILLKNLNVKVRILRAFVLIYCIGFIGMIIYLLSLFIDIDILNRLTDLTSTEQFTYAISRFFTISPENLGDTFSSRSWRWDYAFAMFKDSSLFNMFFGNGFTYIGEYKAQTINNIEDYPHNPIISALLYSGIIGALIVISLFVYTLYNLLKYAKQVGVHLVLTYFAVLAFVFLSGNSMFSYNVYLYFTIMMNFLIHFYKRERIHKSSNNVMDEVA